MTSRPEPLQRPSPIAIRANQLMGKLAAWGFSPSYMVQLTVRGRKSGKLYSTPVNVMQVDGIDYLVAPRGTTNWVRNARAAGEVTLQRSRKVETVHLEELADDVKPPLLKEYLERYKMAVQTYFTVQAGADIAEFVAIADQYPVFRVVRDAGKEPQHPSHL